MFESLSERLSHTLRSISGNARLSEDNIKDTLREVRMALLEADVALPVVKSFVEQVRERAVGQEVSKALKPGQQFLKIVNETLTEVMGQEQAPLVLKGEPASVLMAGLQGAGKTTTLAKLARFLTEREKKKVLVVSVDVYRPAAMDQLQTLATEVGVDCFPALPTQKPAEIIEAAKKEARIKFYDVLLVDTAGRLHVDGEMMAEIQAIHAQLSPSETLFVVDAMTGQDAANTAKAFNEALPLTGVVLTKADGDARGGAALSVRQMTGQPIKFIGMGEKTDALEAFHPDRIASRILGMGDLMSLIEEAERTLDKDKAEKLAKKVKKGKGFDLEDFREQLQQMKKMGGMSSMLEKLPGMGQVAKLAEQQGPMKEMSKMEAIINSMTPWERQKPDLLSGSRKRRICQGSGTQLQDLNRLLKQHKQMQKMMKKMTNKGAIANMMRGMQGQLPPGMGGMGGGGFPPRF
ncbi:signal recognition particle protein [Marinospirillum sp. MEB164]|uniref:Signal recognition particle protein n=1 Tax=Marinospirillum alkalitolerans TaxID=3123374 RepID=A0ABW8PT23_9GAMM